LHDFPKYYFILYLSLSFVVVCILNLFKKSILAIYFSRLFIIIFIIYIFPIRVSNIKKFSPNRKKIVSAVLLLNSYIFFKQFFFPLLLVIIIECNLFNIICRYLIFYFFFLALEIGDIFRNFLIKNFIFKI
jgi:hypothetical protein